MNGCQYMRPSFTLPAGATNTTQMQWDLATMTKSEFMTKYKITEKAYKFCTGY